MLLTKVKSTIARFQMLNPGERVMVAVSGGPDSVCLLSLLHALTKDFGLTLHVAHLDHLFRGSESAEEALFVADLAQKLGIPATVERIDVPEYCRKRGLSSQAGAREVRYAFLSRAAADAGATRIATGHTASDQAETFLMRLVRGAGVSGLSAIPPRRGDIIRPLIEVTRVEVMDYLKANNLAFVTDSSNAKLLYTRNRIRIEVLPVLAKFNPRIIETLASEAALLRDEDEAMEAHLAGVLPGIMTPESGAITLKRAEFISLLPALRRRVLKKAVDALGAESLALSSVQLDEAVSFLSGARTGRSLRLPHGLSLEREYDRFVISAAETAGPFTRELTVPGVTRVQELGLEVGIEVRETSSPRGEIPPPRGLENETAVRGSDGGKQGASGENYRWQAVLDYDKIGFLLTLRNRRPGDRFCPSGMQGRHKKIQDYLVDRKVPRRLRDRLPLLCAGENILWVVGHGTDERFLPGPGTKKLLVVNVRHIE